MAMAGPQQRQLLRDVVASHVMPTIVAAPGPQGTNNRNRMPRIGGGERK